MRGEGYANEEFTAPLNQRLLAQPVRSSTAEKTTFGDPRSGNGGSRDGSAISGLKKQAHETQVNTLVYAMGREAEDVLALRRRETRLRHS